MKVASGLLALALMLVASSASADLAVRGDAERIDRSKLAALVELELGSNTEIEDIVVDIAATRATVALSLRGGGTRSGATDLPEQRPEAVERTIALFIGELSRATDGELPESPLVPAAAPPAPPRPPDTPAPPARREGAGPSLVLGASGRAFTSGGALFIGSFLDGRLDLGDRLQLGVVGAVAAASARVPLGTVKARSVSGELVAAYRIFAWPRVAIRVGSALGVGWIEGSGTGSGARTVAWYGLSARGLVEARWEVARHFLVSIGIDAGALTPGLELQADDRRALAVHGGFAGVCAGLGIGP